MTAESQVTGGRFEILRTGKSKKKRKRKETTNAANRKEL